MPDAAVLLQRHWRTCQTTGHAVIPLGHAVSRRSFKGVGIVLTRPANACAGFVWRYQDSRCIFKTELDMKKILTSTQVSTGGSPSKRLKKQPWTTLHQLYTCPQVYTL
jgi:hypothetical protein